MVMTKQDEYFIGYIYQGQWYVTDVIDAGIKANHTKTFFTYDEIMSIIN